MLLLGYMRTAILCAGSGRGGIIGRVMVGSGKPLFGGRVDQPTDLSDKGDQFRLEMMPPSRQACRNTIAPPALM